MKLYLNQLFVVEIAAKFVDFEIVTEVRRDDLIVY
jgi:hypothetical protein